MPAPLVRGVLDGLILHALKWGPMHGFEIIAWIEARSAGVLEIDDSTLYQSLNRLETRGAVSAEWGVTENNRRARYYELTPKGRTLLRTDGRALARYAQALAAVLSERPA